MQRKLREVYRTADIVGSQRQTSDRLQSIGLGGTLSKPTLEAYQKSIQQSRRDMDQIIAAEARNQEKLAKDIAKRADSLKKLRDEQSKMVKDSKEELDIKEKIAKVEENQYKLRENYKARDQALNEAMDARQRMRPQGLDRLSQAYDKGGLMGMMRAGGRMVMQSPGAAMNVAGLALGGVGTALNFGANAYEQIGRSPFRTLINTGAAIQGTAGRSIEDMQSAYGQSWMQERMRAMQGAGRMDEISRRSDLTRMAAGSAMMGGGALAMGGGLGASGTVIGLPAGLVSMVGGGASMAGGAGMIFGNERTRSLATSGLLSAGGGMINNSMIGKATGGMFGLGDFMKGAGDQQMKEYNSILAKEFAQNFQSALEAEQQTNPLKKLAAQTYDQNFQQYLSAQRTLGLNRDTFHGPGGFRERAINAGFTDQMAMDMSNQIMGAGGSTRMGRDSVLGLQMQRGMGLSNAGQILGTLSGGLGSSEATKQATIKILSEGMRLGLDQSEFAEENRKFTQTVAQVVAQSGAATGADFSRVSEGFGKFVGERTGLGLEAAKTAYEQYQQISQTTTGPRGVMRAAGFMGDDVLGKLSTINKQALMKVPESDLNENNPLVQMAAQEAGVTPQEIVARVSKVNQGSVSRFGQADQIRDRLRSRMQQIGKTNLTAEDISKLPQDMQRDFNQLAAFQTVELGYQGQRETTARALGTINQVGAQTEQERLGKENIIQDKLSSVDRTGRIEDKTVQNLAESSRLALDSFSKFSKEMVPTVDTIRQFNEAMKKSIDAMTKMSPQDQGAFNAIFSKMLGVRGPELQTQSKKNSQ